MNSRFYIFDISKAICIILIVIGHYIPENTPHWHICIWRWITFVDIPAFLFVSGYIYGYHQKRINSLTDYNLFLRKKIKRLILPYYSTSIIIIIIKLLTQGHTTVQNSVSAISFAKMFYQPEAGYFLWYIFTIFTIFVIISICKTKQIRIALLLFSIVLHYCPVSFTHIFALEETKNSLLWFMFGVLIAEHHSFIIPILIKFRNKVSFFVVLCFILLWVISIKSIETISFIIPFVGVPFIIVISYLILHVNNNIKQSFILIGMSSYSIYLFHTTILGFTKIISHNVFCCINDENLNFIFNFFLLIPIGVILPYLIENKLLCKFKITRFLFGL